MSALDDARIAATSAVLQADSTDKGNAAADVLADAAVDAFLAHLADNPPDEMIEAWMAEAIHGGSHADCLSAALYSIGGER